MDARGVAMAELQARRRAARVMRTAGVVAFVAVLLPGVLVLLVGALYVAGVRAIVGVPGGGNGDE